jgi:hypothetical protein
VVILLQDGLPSHIFALFLDRANVEDEVKRTLSNNYNKTKGLLGTVTPQREKDVYNFTERMLQRVAKNVNAVTEAIGKHEADVEIEFIN